MKPKRKFVSFGGIKCIEETVKPSRAKPMKKTPGMVEGFFRSPPEVVVTVVMPPESPRVSEVMVNGEKFVREKRFVAGLNLGPLLDELCPKCGVSIFAGGKFESRADGTSFFGHACGFHSVNGVPV